MNPIDNPPKPEKSLLIWVVEILSLISAGAFLLSGALNTIIFWIWGADFLAIATVSDVAMSGLKLCFVFLFLLTLGSIGTVTVFNIARGDRDISFFAFVPEMSFRLVMPFTIAVTSALYVFDIVQFIGTVTAGVLAIFYNFLILCLLIFLANGFYHRLSKMIVTASAKNTLMFGCTTLAFSLSMLFVVVRWGYDFHPLYVAPLAEAADCTPPAAPGAKTEPAPLCKMAKVLWLGESSLLASCETDQRLIVIKGTENIQLLSRR